MESLLSNKKECYVCGTQISLHKHHTMKGIRNRKKADQDGLWVYLCYNHHEGTYGVHGKEGHKLDMKIIKESQKVWMNHFNKTKEDFIRKYGRNYLD